MSGDRMEAAEGESSDLMVRLVKKSAADFDIGGKRIAVNRRPTCVIRPGSQQSSFDGSVLS